MAALVSLAGILTEQEEAFCMDIAMGVRYVDAFRQHFPEKLDTVKVLAHRLIRKHSNLQSQIVLEN